LNGPPLDDWKIWGLQCSSNGIPLANLSNAVSILDNDPAMKDLFYYDEFLQRIMRADSREWSDHDDLGIVIHIQREVGITRMAREQVAQAVATVANRNTRHCVRDWFESLTYDGTPRIEQFFSDCFGAAQDDYVKAVSRNFWLTMVARTFAPGCKVDNMVVLEGAQGIGKSQALQAIGGDWFAEMHESATNPKGFAEILQGKLLIEITEMDSFNRAEVNRVKQAISCPSDRFRPSYGHRAQDHKRQCVFVGTTNRDDWNRDETGARRFWPIACVGDVRLDIIRENREQLFAEAVQRYKAGEAHWLMPERQTKDEQAARFQADPWLQTIAEIVKGETEVTTAHVAEKLNIQIERRDRGVEMRIGSCLRFMRWERKRARIDGNLTWLYSKSPDMQ
jgi:predicted P-loop ATPase